MTRLTSAQADERYTVAQDTVKSCPEGYGGPAIERLARFENAQQELLQSQAQIAAELERLRQEDKQKSYQFKELLGRKMSTNMMLSLLQAHGLTE